MIIPIGAIINAGAIIVGSIIGMSAGSLITERLRRQILQVFGLCNFGIGLNMFLNNQNTLIVVLSCAFGVIVGNVLNLEGWAYRLGDKLKYVVKSKNTAFIEGFVNSSMIFCVGAMAILGSFEEAIEGRRDIISIKSMLDFFTSMLFASSAGLGVLLSFIIVLFYQGSLTVMAAYLSPYLTDLMRASIEGTGGIIIVGIGINLMEIKKLALINILPALVFAVIFSMLYEKYPIF